MKEIAEAKSLRWVCNQIPDNLGDSNEERMLKAIKEYCKRGADKIEELAEKLIGDIKPRTEEKLIEEMAKVIIKAGESYYKMPVDIECANREVIALYEAGYRKQSDTLREFAAWLHKEADGYDFHLPYELYLAIRAKLKKYGVEKY